MATNAYIGIPGSGKSYEVCVNVLLPAVKRGRRILTNIDGLNPELFYERCKAEKIEKIGEIVKINNEQINSENFYPSVDDNHKADDSQSIVKLGDIVALDEAWEFFREKPTDNVTRYLRLHRHCVNSEGLASDIILITQDLSVLHRQVKVLINETYEMRKIDYMRNPFAKNSKPMHYRVTRYQGAKSRDSQKPMATPTIHKYKVENFALYQSYQGAAGKEEAIDSRTNLLTPKRLFMYGLLPVIGLIYSLYSVSQWTKPKEPKVQISAAPGTNNVTVTQNVPPPPPQNSNEFRLVGITESGGLRHVVISNGKSLLLLSPSICFGQFGYLTCDYEGQKITMHSGSMPSAPSNSFVPQ